MSPLPISAWALVVAFTFAIAAIVAIAATGACWS